MTSDHVAWLRFFRHDGRPTTLHICDSDAPGAFKVYRHPAQITDEMVNRFIAWKLPSDFGPDAGVSFKPPTHPNGWPTGTNLLTATQARAMLEHVVLGLEQPHHEGNG